MPTLLQNILVGSARPARFVRSRRVLLSTFLTTCLVLLATLSAVAPVSAEQNKKSVRYMAAGDQVSIVGDGCQPQVLARSEQRFKLRCLTERRHISNPTAAEAKEVILLSVSEKLLIRRTDCALRIKSATATRILILCE